MLSHLIMKPSLYKKYEIQIVLAGGGVGGNIRKYLQIMCYKTITTIIKPYLQ